MKKIKKHHFLFIELIIAFTIVSLVALPLVRNPIKSFQSQLDILEKSECERIADLTFGEIKQKLYRNEILWQELPQKGDPKITFNYKPITVHIEGFINRAIPRMATIKTKKEKKGDLDSIYRLLEIEIILMPPSLKHKKTKTMKFTHQCLIKKIALEEKK